MKKEYTIQLTGDIRKDEKTLKKEINRLKLLIQLEDLQESMKEFNERNGVVVTSAYVEFYSEYDDEGGYYPSVDSFDIEIEVEGKPVDWRDLPKPDHFRDDVRDLLGSLAEHMNDHDYERIIRSEDGSYEFID